MAMNTIKEEKKDLILILKSLPVWLKSLNAIGIILMIVMYGAGALYFFPETRMFIEKRVPGSGYIFMLFIQYKIYNIFIIAIIAISLISALIIYYRYLSRKF